MEAISFSNVNPGAWFSYRGALYMKLYGNRAQFHRGGYWDFADNDKVTPAERPAA
jgi:hypothetical protein